MKDTPSQSPSRILWRAAALGGRRWRLLLRCRLPGPEDEEGHRVPGVVNANVQQKQRCTGDDKEGWLGMADERNRPDEESEVSDCRKDDMEDPILEHGRVFL